MTTCDLSSVCVFDEDSLLAQLNELLNDQINLTNPEYRLKRIKRLLILFYDLKSTKNRDFESDLAKSLFEAVDLGHLKLLKWLKKHDFDIIFKDVEGYTILHQAAKNGAVEIVEWLVTADVIDVNVKDRYFVTPLIGAAEAKQYELMKWLVEHGADVNSASAIGDTCVMVAASRGHVELLNWLIQHGADIHAKRHTDSATALLLAARTGHLDAVQWLAEYGCSVNAKCLDGTTALYWAAYEGHSAVVHWLVENNAEVDCANLRGNTPLMFVANRGDLELVKWLVDHGANAKNKDGCGMTPFLTAVGAGHLALAQWFVQRSFGDVNDTMNGAQTPLHIAAGYCHLDFVQWLTANGADVHALTDRFETPLFIASKRGHLDIVQWLAKQGADVNAAAKQGDTPLHVACKQGHFNVVKWLMDNGADVNAANTDDETPILVSAKCGRSQLVHWLAENGADVNAADSDGSTAMCLAVTRALLDVSQALVEYGADINRADSAGFTPLLLAAREGHLALIDWLMNNGADVHAVACARDALCWTLSSATGSTMGRQKEIVRLILAGASLESSQETDLTKLSPLQYAVDASFFRLLLVAGAEPTKDDVRHIQYNRIAKYEAIISLLLKKPSLIETIEDKELRAMCSDRKKIEKVERQMKASAQEWQRLVWQLCHERVTDLTMVFVDQATLIIAEICFVEQKYLRGVPLHWVIDRIENVKRIKQ